MSNANSNAETYDCLITPRSLQLSLSAPRAPPSGTYHHSVLCNPLSITKGNEKPQIRTKVLECDGNRHTAKFFSVRSNGSKDNRMERARQPEKQDLYPLPRPHPHIPFPIPFGDVVTRNIFGRLLPVPLMNRLRDSGAFRSISDTLVTMNAPFLAAFANPSTVFEFIHLTRAMKHISYGSHSMQQIHLYEPADGRRRGFVFFVHGGAWGSGLPWMYRLVALPFLELGMTVAIVGYRTYPDTNVTGQVNDLFQALSRLLDEFPSLFTSPQGGETCDFIGTILMGHSSGAHLSLLMMVEYIQRQLSNSNSPDTVPSIFFNYVIGLSGPYNISQHFDFEAHRGVEELSPMKPACGHTREEFMHHSPTFRLLQLCYIAESSLLQPNIKNKHLMPSMLLVHGMKDSTVPFTSTSDAAALFKSCGAAQCDEIYIGTAGHQDTVLHLMLGGRTKTAVVKWIQLQNQMSGQNMKSLELVAASKI